METISIGTTTCHFIDANDWLKTCSRWLKTSQYHHVVTLNPEMVIQAQSDSAFRQSLNRADIRLPDGSGLIWARWYLRSRYWPWLASLIAFLWQSAPRVTGVDAVNNLARLCAKHDRPIYLLGGNQKATTIVATKLHRRHPSLKVFVSPAHIYDENGPDSIIADIINRQPAIVFAAYGAPKQTIWLEKHRSQLSQAHVNIGLGVGGAFDILSEKLPRAPRSLRRVNMEWLWRLYLEPKRAPRIWRAVIKFPLLIRRQKISQAR